MSFESELVDLVGEFSGVVSVGRGADVEFERAYGLADRARQVPITVDTRFGIASGTKGLTPVTVMSLVDDELLALDTPARALLGDDLPLPVMGSGDGGSYSSAAHVRRFWRALFDGRRLPAARATAGCTGRRGHRAPVQLRHRVLARSGRSAGHARGLRPRCLGSAVCTIGPTARRSPCSPTRPTGHGRWHAGRASCASRDQRTARYRERDQWAISVARDSRTTVTRIWPG